MGGKTILILKEPFKILYTGLKRAIGSPKDYVKNKEEGNFPSNLDLSIPLNETTESGRKVEPNVNDYYDN